MKLPQLSLRELFLLVTLAALGLGWWVHHSISANTLHWVTLRANTNDGAIIKISRAFEQEGYTCDLIGITTDYGDFYTDLHVTRPTDTSFHVELPGERFRPYSVATPDAPP
jgi:hypothetical protein